MNDVGPNYMRKRGKEGENELWSYLSAGDGKKCPLDHFCQLKSNESVRCFNNEANKDYFEVFQKLVDNDEIYFTENKKPDFDPECIGSGRIFELVTRLARKLRTRNWNKSLPVPDNLILADSNNFPIGESIADAIVPRGTLSLSMPPL